MAQRISRAKARIRASDVPFAMPPARGSRERLRSVLPSGTGSSTRATPPAPVGSLHRVDLSDEAIRLARSSSRPLPADGEAPALLALMLLTDARRPARLDAEASRSSRPTRTARAGRARIAEGTRALDARRHRGPLGEYGIQAAIAAVHDRGRIGRGDRLAADRGALRRRRR